MFSERRIGGIQKDAHLVGSFWPRKSWGKSGVSSRRPGHRNMAVSFRRGSLDVTQ